MFKLNVCSHKILLEIRWVKWTD